MTAISNSQPNEVQSSEGGADVRSGLVYLLAGGGIGAAMGLLFSPKPGSKLRNDIADWTLKNYSEAEQALETVVDIPNGKPAPASSRSENILELVPKRPSSSMNSYAGRTTKRNGSGGRRSASIV